jgi:hypothetical protein
MRIFRNSWRGLRIIPGAHSCLPARRSKHKNRKCKKYPVLLHVNSPLMEFGNLIILLKVGEPKGTM